MNTSQIIWLSTLTLTIVAAVLDWRSRRIPNWLTMPGMVLGVAVHTYVSGWRGTLFALEGAGLALILLVGLVLIRALGAGDWKLMGAVGAFMGPILVLFILLGSILAAGLMAMIQMMRTHRVVETFRNMIVLVRGFFTFGFKVHPVISLDNPQLLKVPYGVAVAIATLICCCAAHWVA